MPDQFDFCCYDLTQTGASAEMAKRACSIAFWQQNGMSPAVAAGRGVNPPGSITVAAKRVYSQLSEAGGNMLLCVSSRSLATTVRLDQFGYQAEDCEAPREMREAVVLYPGTFNGVDFTADDCKAYADNYDPANPPPVILDHDMTNADNCHGYVRGLMWDAEAQELVALAEFLGEHAVERVRDRRWKRLSGAFMISEDPFQRVMVELSVTLRPAVAGARVLSKSETVEATMPNPEQEKEEAAPAEVAAPETETAPEDQPAEEPVETPAPAAPVAQMSAAEVEVIELRAQVAKLASERAELRVKEDKKDWQLLLAEGYTEPSLGPDQLAFMATLSEPQKEQFLTLCRKRGKMHQFGRKSSPEVPNEPIEDTNVQLSEKQNLLMGAMRQAAGIPQSTNGHAAK